MPLNVCIADENDSDLRYSEVPLKGKNTCQNIGGRQHKTTPAGQILGVETPAALTPMQTTTQYAGCVFNREVSFKLVPF